MTSEDTDARARAHAQTRNPGRAHDMPPKWDGARVTWTPWEPEVLTTMVFHTDPNNLACTACGLIEATYTARGRVHLPDGVTELHPLHQRLRAKRCPGCAHDTVYDLETDELWDLDDSDYVDDGSTVEGALW